MPKGPTLSAFDKLISKIKPKPVVAIVDDDTATLDLLKRVLEIEGCEVHRFTSAEELIQRFNEIQPDALVMEAILPGISGLTALEELKPASPETVVPTMILSKKSDIQAKLLAFRRGAFDYVTKPFNPEEVAVRVRSLARTKILQEMLYKSALSDPLTSLYNRRFLLVWLGREIERVKRYGMDLSCLLVDWDRFRQINKEKGEPFGDYCLREFAGVLNQTTRRADIVGRIQNDEFLLFLPGTSKEQAIQVARRLRESISHHSFEWKGKKTSPSFCIGIVGCHSKEAPEPSAFLERAEEALRKAKAVGANQTAVLEAG
jgi:diguanylate cyclase (GGDEF)-like protein